MFFVSPAFAQAAVGALPAPSPLTSMLPLVLIFGVFYFLLIRPQQKKMKQHQALLENLKRGDKIVTAGGVFATIEQVDAQELSVKIADGVVVRVQKSTVSTVLTKSNAAPTAANANSAKTAKSRK